MKTLRGIGAVVGALALTIAFQNCNKQNLTGGGSPPAALDQASQGGGTIKAPPADEAASGGGNYDGKVWAVVDASVTCADGSHLISRLRGLSVGFQLERLNCQTVNPPTLLAATDVSVDATSAFVTYQQRVFTAQPTAAAPTPPALALVCDTPPGDLPLSVLVYAGTPLRGRAIAYAEPTATTVRADSGIVNLDVIGAPPGDYGGRKADGSVAFDLSLLVTLGTQKVYFVSGVNVKVAPGGTFNADKFDFLRTAVVQCRAQ